ncbi:hypothetical protein UFOVP121_63 [uncultured Caudovirales phage]|uniref:Uncharacterized protein n=1 Tax=uncultured Caudovirales phage TaxID=2100421 RepID=A0A6J5LAT3_9CAUD|nr:hypothetical protein UFOVP121_63 [uncultured Caudovirales phage]CAB4135082.1 hypothetical protein UFOVP277_68 [uncultured Caudovirales phage]
MPVQTIYALMIIVPFAAFCVYTAVHCYRVISRQAGK